MPKMRRVSDLPKLWDVKSKNASVGEHSTLEGSTHESKGVDKVEARMLA